MAKVIPSGQSLGASVEGLDLSRPLSGEEFEFALNALAEHGVLRYPRQELSALQLKDFSARWGELEINVANMYQEPGVPEVMILSNIVENGKPIGLADAGQSWHTDMSYSKTIAFCNVLYGIRIPHRNGEPLGNNPGYSMRINELPQKESDAVLEFLFEHQTQPKFRFAARWQVGDVLMWDNLRTIHNAVADYSPDEPRLIKRCQVMATRFFQERS